MELQRCLWCGTDPIYQKYHDEDWGVPVHDDRLFFEMLTLEGAQAGLSWITILKRRQAYKELFDNFDVQKVANYSEARIAGLLQDERIIRNKGKIYSTVSNAQAFIKVQEEFGSFDSYIWEFVGGKPKLNHFNSHGDIPAKTAESDAMSKALKKRGFKFVGSTICYAFMQACGLVNDHTAGCFKYQA